MARNIFYWYIHNTKHVSFERHINRRRGDRFGTFSSKKSKAIVRAIAGYQKYRLITAALVFTNLIQV